MNKHDVIILQMNDGGFYRGSMIISCKGQSSCVPSGRCLLMTKGIIFSRSSSSAIFNGSDSPLVSTITGAFIEICTARVPHTLAFSYFVMYGEVILGSSLV